MNVTYKKEFTDEVVHVEGAFLECTFNGCQMFFGGEYFVFEKCKLNQCTWRFHGAAQRTLNALAIFGVDLSVLQQTIDYDPGEPETIQ